MRGARRARRAWERSSRTRAGPGPTRRLAPGPRSATAAEPLGFDSGVVGDAPLHRLPHVAQGAQFLTWVASRTERVQARFDGHGAACTTRCAWPRRSASSTNVGRQGAACGGLGRGLGRGGVSTASGSRWASPAGGSPSTPRAILSGWRRRDALRRRAVPPAPVEIRPRAGLVPAGLRLAISPETSRILARNIRRGMMIIAQKPVGDGRGPTPRLPGPVPEINGESAEAAAGQLGGRPRERGGGRGMFERWIMGYCAFHPGPLRVRQPGRPRSPARVLRQLRHRQARPEDFARFLPGSRCGGRRPPSPEQLRENVRRSTGAGVVACFNYAGMPTTSPRPTSAASPIGPPALHAIDTGPPVGRVTATVRDGRNDDIASSGASSPCRRGPTAGPAVYRQPAADYTRATTWSGSALAVPRTPCWPAGRRHPRGRRLRDAVGRRRPIVVVRGDDGVAGPGQHLPASRRPAVETGGGPNGASSAPTTPGRTTSAGCLTAQPGAARRSTGSTAPTSAAGRARREGHGLIFVRPAAGHPTTAHRPRRRPRRLGPELERLQAGVVYRCGRRALTQWYDPSL